MEEYSFADNENMNEDVEQITLISGENKTICKHCGKILSAKASHGTNSLNTHVKSCNGLQSQSTSEGSQGTVRMRQFDKTHETYAKTEFANMIIMHEYPLSMVEHLGFKRYSKALQHSFIQMNTSKIANTTDMWTASNQKKCENMVVLFNDSCKLVIFHH
ncbi:hypothetical protein ACLB2K_063028 [Fragaria x ananassa]